MPHSYSTHRNIELIVEDIVGENRRNKITPTQ